MSQTTNMTGGCYCGALRYAVTQPPVTGGQCHCRACQYFSGGNVNFYMLIPSDSFAYTAGTPASYTRPDKENAVTRDFCATCGTHVTTRRPGLKQLVLKIGTLDDPALFPGPQMAIFTEEGQPFHIIPDGVPAFETLPPMRR
ncbi:GFA family protein [Chachezhania sediminis]|uniref:GFA family protein n=1 Tax=Chachezhania sediminis TaxID=2599291 RepID=UPI0018EED78C|nr:GFA family protein [Chachezhania sediminis]